MRLRSRLLFVATVSMLAVAGLSSQQQQPQRLLVLEWAAKAPKETPPVAVLIEMGRKDAQPSSWSGRANVTGARVVHREGYRFRDPDRLVEPDGWEASSHRPLRAPKNQPAVLKMEGLVPVGVVLHLADVADGATLTLEPKGKEFERTEISLADVLAGKPATFQGGRAVVRRVSYATPVATTPTEDDFPAAAYGPDGTLWVAYISYTLKEESRRTEKAQIKQEPADFKAYYTPEFGDQLFVKSYRDGKWSEPIAVTGPKGDLVRCAVTVEGDGTVWVGYSARRENQHPAIFVRPITRDGKVGREQRLEQSSDVQIDPAMTTDQEGRARLLCQSWTCDLAEFASFTGQSGKWLKDVAMGTLERNLWSPTFAPRADGGIAVFFDEYAGDYDVRGQMLYGKRNTLKDSAIAVASSTRFEARPSIAYDPAGRLWIAYEEGPELWGKDSGALARTGEPLYSDRSVRVVCLDTDGTLKRPVAELPSSKVGNPGAQTSPQTTNSNERATRYSMPRIGIDGKGRVWLTYRQNFGSRYTTHAGNYGLTFARRLDGDHWTEPLEIHHSDGLVDSRAALLPHAAGGLIVVHNTDGRMTTPKEVHNQVYLSVVDLPGEPVEPQLKVHDPGTKNPKLVKEAEVERAAVKRLRDYRIDVGGKTYRPLRGEFHRHTEISWDGCADGSLEDMFRYGIDAAAMDWIGNGDHDSGAGREYSWWLIQKLTDAYHVAGAFTPMFTYERSVAYPHGHRNCMFAKRGVRTLPRLAPEPGKGVGGAHANDTKMLYRYLHELDGICASHTSATGMGTDWRDNDPEVESVVEIYQGDRNSYEYPDAPRAGHDPASNQLPTALGGWRPAGFIDNALRDKHYRLGFQASSDHWSTHISYCIPLAERHDRAAILDAMKKRHCYGATDNILLDVRSGDHLMGDAFQTAAAPSLWLNVVGTGPVERVDIHKDSKVVATFSPNKPAYHGTWTDPDPTPGVHYYYVRVLQTDGQLAWASPMWVDYTR